MSAQPTWRDEYPHIAGLVRFVFTVGFCTLWGSLAAIVVSLMTEDRFDAGYACGVVATLVMWIRER
jgi:hypothetical protein